jgi:hypothetical protein
MQVLATCWLKAAATGHGAHQGRAEANERAAQQALGQLLILRQRLVQVVVCAPWRLWTTLERSTQGPDASASMAMYVAVGRGMRHPLHLS